MRRLGKLTVLVPNRGHAQETCNLRTRTVQLILVNSIASLNSIKVTDPVFVQRHGFLFSLRLIGLMLSGPTRPDLIC